MKFFVTDCEKTRHLGRVFRICDENTFLGCIWGVKRVPPLVSITLIASEGRIMRCAFWIRLADDVGSAIFNTLFPIEGKNFKFSAILTVEIPVPKWSGQGIKFF